MVLSRDNRPRRFHWSNPCALCSPAVIRQGESTSAFLPERRGKARRARPRRL